MKFSLSLIFCVIAAFGLGQGRKLPVLQDTISPYISPELAKDLIDFVRLIPADKVIKIIVDYISHDSNVPLAFAYVFTDEFHTALKAVEALKEHTVVISYLKDAGLDPVESINAFHKAIGMGEYVPPKDELQIGVQKIGDGLKGMLDDIAAVIPVDKIQALFEEKLKTSPVFAAFAKKMYSSELKQDYEALRNTPAFQDMAAKCKAAGLDLRLFRDFYRKVIPKMPTQSFF